MANSKEITISFEGWLRAAKRRFSKLAEKEGVMNGWCSDGHTIRLLFPTEFEKAYFTEKVKQMPNFNGEGKIEING